MSIRKSHRKDVSNSYVVSGREYVHLDCLLPSGEQVQISIQLGSRDVNGKEYFSIDALFDKNAEVELSNCIPQSAQLLVRLPLKVKL